MAGARDAQSPCRFAGQLVSCGGQAIQCCDLLPMDRMHEDLIAYRVVLSRNDTPASTLSNPRFLAIVRAANLTSAYREAQTLVTSLHGHYTIVEVQEDV